MPTVLASTSERIRGIPARHGRRTVIVLALILLVGFALRADRVVNPIARPGDDAAAYLDLSRSLYEDGTYGSPGFENTSDWSPGAPLLYAAAFYATGGVREGTVRILNTLLGCIGIVVVYLLGVRLASRATGLLAAGAVALYPPFIHSTGAILSEPPALLTLPAAVLAFLWADERRQPAAWLVPGFLFGLTALIRPEYLAVAVAFAILALFREWRRGGWRSGALITGLLVLAFLGPVVPWTIRNYVVLDRFVPLSTGAGKALYVGSYLTADGDYQRVKAILVSRYLGRNLEPGSAALDRVDPVPLFNRVAARYPDLPRDSALGKIGKQNLRDDIENHPLDYSGMLVRKVARMWGTGVGPAMDTTLGRIAQRALLALALAGLALLAWRRRWEAIAFAIPIAMITAIGAISLAANRRNEILMTLVMPLAATATTAGARWIRERAGGGIAAPAHSSAQT
jgi:4-amino-4-deoxy-L-arabinose transferase-like glycosyltransferase